MTDFLHQTLANATAFSYAPRPLRRIPTESLDGAFLLTLLRQEESLLEKFLAESDAGWVVHGEDIDRRSPDGGFADQHRPIPPEMFRPKVPSRIEQLGELFCLWIDAREVWAFVEVAAKARIGKIAEGVAAPVLLGDDMLCLKRRDDVRFGEAAVFAAARRALPHLLLGGFVHPWNLVGFSS